MQLPDNEIHIWSTSLALSSEQEHSYLLLLNADEQKRAARFRFPEHRRRFIIARAVLRQILCFYTKIAPDKIEFSYNEHDKPALVLPADKTLQFNLSHSADLAVYAIARQLVGIDVEQIQSRYELGLPERFFSAQECEHLQQVPEHERVIAFYRLWARKEAIIKASGKGLSIPLSNFSVSAYDDREKIVLGHEVWYLQPLTLDPAFAAALASQQDIDKLLYYHFPTHM
jgi:4'-phosphopantetheinyl transferase